MTIPIDIYCILVDIAMRALSSSVAFVVVAALVAVVVVGVFNDSNVAWIPHCLTTRSLTISCPQFSETSPAISSYQCGWETEFVALLGAPQLLLAVWIIIAPTALSKTPLDRMFWIYLDSI